MANVIKGKDGKWGAVDARQLYVQAKTAGYLYQAHLRAELTRRLGVEWTPVRKGTADIEGIHPKVIRAFSKRRSEIEALIEETNHDSAKAAEVAALATRKAKDYRVSGDQLLSEWRQRADRLGLDRQALDWLLHRAAYRVPNSDERRRIETDLAGPAGLTSQVSSFSRREVIQGFCERIFQGAAVEHIERLADSFLSSESVVPLSSRSIALTDGIRVRSGQLVLANREEPRYSTTEMLETERAVIDRAIVRRLEGSGKALDREVERALSTRPSLYRDQRAMVRRLTNSGLGVEVVVGKAGAGKTFALDATRDAWAASGYRVIGCALSARAAQELQSGSGIESYTITGLLQDLDHPIHGVLGEDSVIVVDEAGMVGTRTLDRLLAHAEDARAKVVLVGDDRQLPEIEAGGAFRGIMNRLPAIELSEVRRQPFGWERDALNLIREGRAEDAIDAYTAHDRVVVARSSEETRRQLVADWWATQDDKHPAIMIAARRSEVGDLNDRARQLMAAEGRLGKASMEVGGRPFSKGDRVMTLKNSRGLGVVNGTRGTVERIDARCNEVTIRRDDGSTVTLPRSYLEAGHLTHAYALTGHKSQGMTADRAFVLGDETLYREWTYVAMSRGCHENRLYVVAGIDPEREEVGGEVAAITDPLKELVSSVGRSRAKELALDAYEYEDIRNLATTQLRREWEKSRRVVAQMPNSVEEKMTELTAERVRLEQLLEYHHDQVREAERELRTMGVLSKRRNRAKAASLKRNITNVKEGTLRVTASLQALNEKEAALQMAVRARETWLVKNAPALTRLDVIGRELWRRQQQRATAAEVAMPHDLVEAVRERSINVAERPQWDEVVQAIESNRESWASSELARPPGQNTATADRSRNRTFVQHRIEAARGCSEREIGERSIEL